MNKLKSEPIYISLEEFEKILSTCYFEKLFITPVLQIWNNITIGNYRATGYLIVSGICEREFLVASYVSEGTKQENIDYEKDKFSELINLSLVEPLIKKDTICKNIVLEEVIVK